VVDRPVIQHAVEEARAAGIEEFIFVTAPHKHMLEDHFSPFPLLEETLKAQGKTAALAAVMACNLTPKTVIQPRPLGLGHAVLCARELVGDEPFVVMLPDDLFLPRPGSQGAVSQLVTSYQTYGGNLCSIITVAREETKRYGVISPGEDDGHTVAITGMVEKPDPSQAPSTLAIMGRYILQPAVFDYLATQTPGAGGEIQLTDAMAKMIGTLPFHGVRFDGVRYDCGTTLGFIETNLAYGLRDPVIGKDVQKILQRLHQNAS
jgi:UTP--glucose-1-phosphate uridylyltransferase